MTTLEQIGAVRVDLVPWTAMPVLGHVWASDPRKLSNGIDLTVKRLVDKNGRPRSTATMPGFRKGIPNCNRGKVFEPSIFTVGEVQIMIMGRSRTSSSGKRDRALIAMAYGCGARISELLDLLPSDVREENGTWRVLIRCGKGSKRRVVGLAPDAVPYLLDWLERREGLGVDRHSRLFCTIAKPNIGGPLGSPQVRSMLKRIATTAGIEKRVTPHQFRHSLAVEMSRRGVPLPIIARQLGHSNVATTSTYLRGLSDDEMFDTMADFSWSTEDEAAVA